MFGAQMATCSPGWNRVSSAWAARSAAARSSAYVHRRRMAGSGHPSTRADASGAAAAASRRTPPTVLSSTGSDGSGGKCETVRAMPDSLARPGAAGKGAPEGRTPSEPEGGAGPAVELGPAQTGQHGGDRTGGGQIEQDTADVV